MSDVTSLLNIVLFSTLAFMLGYAAYFRARSARTARLQKAVLPYLHLMHAWLDAPQKRNFAVRNYYAEMRRNGAVEDDATITEAIMVSLIALADGWRDGRAPLEHVLGTVRCFIRSCEANTLANTGDVVRMVASMSGMRLIPDNDARERSVERAYVDRMPVLAEISNAAFLGEEGSRHA